MLIMPASFNRVNPMLLGTCKFTSSCLIQLPRGGALSFLNIHNHHQNWQPKSHLRIKDVFDQGEETGLVFELDISWSFEESWNSESGFLSELGGGKSRWFETLISRLHLQVRHRSCFCFQRQQCTNSMPTTTTTDGGRVAAWTNRFFPSAACHHRHHYEYY